PGRPPPARARGPTPARRIVASHSTRPNASSRYTCTSLSQGPGCDCDCDARPIAAPAIASVTLRPMRDGVLRFMNMDGPDQRRLRMRTDVVVPDMVGKSRLPHHRTRLLACAAEDRDATRG